MTVWTLLVSLNEQQFVDGDTSICVCIGGPTDSFFPFAEKNDISAGWSYPYTAKGNTCSWSSCTVGLPHGGGAILLNRATDTERAFVAIAADKSSFQAQAISTRSHCVL